MVGSAPSVAATSPQPRALSHPGRSGVYCPAGKRVAIAVRQKHNIVFYDKPAFLNDASRVTVARSAELEGDVFGLFAHMIPRSG